MTTTAAELRIEQLRKDLADAEAAQQAKKTIVSEFNDAELEVNEARRLVRISKQSLAEAAAGLEALSRDSSLIPQGMSGMRSQHDQKTQQANQEIHRLTVENNKLARELGKKEAALGRIVEQIAEHPAYKAARAKQRQLVTEAATLASSLFTVPLDDLKSVLNKIATLADAEQQLLNGALGELRADGLPDLKPVLDRFLQEVTPHAVLEALPGVRAQIVQAVATTTEQASRPVQR